MPEDCSVEGTNALSLHRGLVRHAPCLLSWPTEMRCVADCRYAKHVGRQLVPPVGDEERIVRFGDASMGHYRDGSGGGHGDEGRRANFKARHNCDEKTDKLTAGYWSCNWSW